MEQAIASDLADPDGVAQILGADSEDGAERANRLPTDPPDPRCARCPRQCGIGRLRHAVPAEGFKAAAVHDAALGRRRTPSPARTFARSMRRLGFNHLMPARRDDARSAAWLDGRSVDTRLFSDSRSVAQDVRRPDVQASLDDWSEYADGHTGALSSSAVARGHTSRRADLRRLGSCPIRATPRQIVARGRRRRGPRCQTRARSWRRAPPWGARRCPDYAAAERDDIAEDWANMHDAHGCAARPWRRNPSRGRVVPRARADARESGRAQQVGASPESAYRDQLSRLCAAIARSVWPKAALLPSPEVDAPAH